MTELDAALYYEGQELSALEQAKNYYNWLVHEFDSALHGKILEVGAGTGTLSEILLARSCEHSLRFFWRAPVNISSVLSLRAI